MRALTRRKRKRGDTHSAIDAFAEATFAGVLEGWGDAVRPDELVDVEGAATSHGTLVRDLVLSNEHLVS